MPSKKDDLRERQQSGAPVSAAEAVSQTSATPAPKDASLQFITAWNRLVSTTNWDKGRIICEWRAALIADGAPASEYSDEAWANLVGGVTGQHVGRLRRVYERFGDVFEEYPDVYWSHFQIAMEWDDAEMWLEGAVQNEWSISQMRAKRWKTLGAPDDLKPSEDDIVVAEIEEDALSINGQRPTSPSTAEVKSIAGATQTEDLQPTKELDQHAPASSTKRLTTEGQAAESKAAQPAEKHRPFANLPKLPDDVAEAFEQFKLAILTHKLAGWTKISRDDMIACLESLTELAILPADGSSDAAQ